MKRKLDRLSVLEHVADALHVPVHVLLDDEAFQRNAGCVDPVEVAALRSALLEHRMAVPRTQPGAPPEPGAPRDPVPAEVAALQAQLRYAWSAFQASDYAALGPLLGRMLTAAHATASSGSDDGRQVTALLSEIYQVIASTTRKLGYVELVWVAAERSQVLAEQTDDPVLRGGAAFRLVNAMKDNNGGAAAVHSAQRAGDDLASGGDASRPEVRSLFGHTLLQGAMAAAAADDSAGARAFLTDARSTAASLGVDRNDYYTAFGPTNVTIHEVAAMVELREWTTALKAVSAMGRGPAGPPAPRAPRQPPARDRPRLQPRRQARPGHRRTPPRRRGRAPRDPLPTGRQGPHRRPHPPLTRPPLARPHTPRPAGGGHRMTQAAGHQPVLYVIACAAPPARDVQRLVQLA